MAIISRDQTHATLAAHRTHITGLNPGARWLIGLKGAGFRHLVRPGGVSRLTEERAALS